MYEGCIQDIYMFFFFFQAEDGIRDIGVTGVQTCALPIFGISRRLAEGGIEPGDVVILLGRHSIEAAVAMLGCLHRGVVLAPLPPMFNETQLSALAEQTQAVAIVTFGGEKEIAKCRQVAGDRLMLVTVTPEDVDAWARQDMSAEHSARHADDLALVLHSSGTTSAP